MPEFTVELSNTPNHNRTTITVKVKVCLDQVQYCSIKTGPALI